jgi:deoxyadenosine/deoxycytidine kinase
VLRTLAEQGGDLVADRTARYISVEGPIGVGKTALARRLAADFGTQLILEQVEDNPFLRKFYEDPSRYAFQAQLFFLLERYRQQRGVHQQGVPQNGLIADYLFAKDGIFAGVTLGAEEGALYKQTFALLDRELPRPDLVIYLEARPDVLLKRIKKRGLEYERTINKDYLERLTEAFRNFFHHYTDAPLLVVNSSDIDFVEHGGDLADLINEIRGMRQGVQHYIPLGSR